MNNCIEQITASYELVTKRKFNQFIKTGELLLKPLAYEEKFESLVVWLLLFLGMFETDDTFIDLFNQFKILR